MQYYSEKTKKLYMSENALVEAEKAYDEKNALELKKREERAIRAKEVDEAYQHYQELLKKFLDDYGYYHRTDKKGDIDFFQWFTDNWWPF